MDNILCSVVMSTFNRGHLLTRSLVCYEKQEFPKDRFELVIVDDGSNDDTADLCNYWSNKSGIKLTYLVPYPKKDGWRDCAATINFGIRVSQGKYILLTHPEIMVGRTSVIDCVTQLEKFESNVSNQEIVVPDGADNTRVLRKRALGLYACCRAYYLSPRNQELIDTCSWRTEGPIVVRAIDGFYENDIGGHPDFSHRATDIVAQPGSRIPHWQSWIFGGHSRRTWRKLGGMLPTTKWGSCDVGWMHRRQVLDIANYTCPNESAIVVHQNHDLPSDIKTPRIPEDWQKELNSIDMSNPNNLIYPQVDEIGW